MIAMFGVMLWLGLFVGVSAALFILILLVTVTILAVCDRQDAKRDAQGGSGDG